jgi:heme-degrading monooxygenase HmoA
MFARIVTFTCKPGQAKQVATKLGQNALPFLKAQHGFLDLVVLVSITDPNEVIGQSFWTSREDAGRYNLELYPRIRDSVQDGLASTPVVETYDVDTSTAHRIAAGKIAA